jgi:hypothetical protein
LIEDIVSNVLANVIAVVALRVGVAARAALRGKRRGEGTERVRWLEAYRVMQPGPDMPALSGRDEAGISGVLRSDEVQAVLHELLAARLTGAEEADVGRIRLVWKQTLEAVGPAGLLVSEGLFEYYDSEASVLVSRMKAEAPELLRELRDEAFNVRMVSTLNAIERHARSLSAGRERQTDEDFLARYRRHVIDHHGKLEPPDFDRRRRVPIRDLYVAPTIVQVADADSRDPPVEISLWALAGQVDRTVLLGDPGGGKTTASNALLAHHAAGAGHRVPFLVTLREFAAQDPPDRSVVGYIEHRLEAFYQCPAGAGLVDQLLLTGHALVIFDGLDELLDASRRAEAAAIVEQFCAEYPLAGVLVTSRIVGYDQARLDDRQFSVYRLGGLSDDQVGDYARKWFSQEEGIPADEAGRLAGTFLDESAAVADLRSTPLMLSLMCILYRGEGSLPRNRAQVYEQCALLLHRRWDARRRINVPLRAGHPVERSLRHLAWWMFTLDDARTAVTERELVTEEARFLHDRGFEEAQDDARSAAEEFISTYRGRMWVLSETGVTAAGESLYAFTHRTFLEYFAAEHLAYSCDSPEDLADALAPKVAASEWDTLGELAMQVKDQTSDEGGRRLYARLLERCDGFPAAGRSAVLQFLSRGLRSVDPAPATVRTLTTAVLDHLLTGDPDDPVRYLPLCWLMASAELHKDIVSGMMRARTDAMIASADPAPGKAALHLAIWAPYGITWFGDNGPHVARQSPLARYWRDRRDDSVRAYAGHIIKAAADDPGMRNTAIWANLITLDQAREMPGGVIPLFRHWPTGIFGGRWGGELLSSARNIATNYFADDAPSLAAQASQLATLGRYLDDHRLPPWVTGAVRVWPGYFTSSHRNGDQPDRPLDPLVYLGAAVSLLIAAEAASERTPHPEGPRWFGPLSGLHAYILRRWELPTDEELRDLPVPDNFRPVFRDWAARRVDFVSP